MKKAGRKRGEERKKKTNNSRRKERRRGRFNRAKGDRRDGSMKVP